jgi:lipopolysaccharide transport system permease protein
VFGHVAKLSSGGVPYLVFSFAGLLAWNLFTSVISRGMASLVSNAALVSKVFFPRILVPFSTSCSALVDFGVAFGMLGVLLGIYGLRPGPEIFLMPIWLLLLLLLANGIGSVASAMMVHYRDVQYVVPFVLQFLLYASPVGYALNNVPHRYRWIFDINPITWILEEFRWSLLRQPAPSGLFILLSVVVCVGIFVIGSLIFEQMERSFADVI